MDLSKALRALRARWDLVVVLGLCAAWAVGWSLYFSHAGGGAHPAEKDLIRSAVDHLSGRYTTGVKYPSFMYYFFGGFFALLGAQDDPSRCLAIARGLNTALFCLNLVLFHLFALRYLAPRWATLATFLFPTVPAVALSGALVKAEALIIALLLLTLLALHRSLDAPSQKRWNVLAALCAGLALSTKIFVLPVLLYGLHWLYLARRDRELRWRELLLYTGVLTATVLVTWTNLWMFDQIMAGWKSDLYFLDEAAPFRAVDERFAFPHGRFSSFLLTVLPFSLGLILLLFFLGSLVTRPLPGWYGWVFGTSTALAVTTTLIATLARHPQVFTPYLPFFIVPAVAFAQDCTRRTSRWVGAALVAVLLAQPVTLAAALPGLVDSLSKNGALVAKYRREKSLMVVMFPEPFLNRRVPPSRKRWPLEVRLQRRKPTYLYLFSAYLLNMCKYTDNALYRRDCAFFHKLKQGRGGYTLVTRIPLNMPGRIWLLDPEYRHAAFYLFKRSPDPTQPRPRPRGDP